MKRDRKRQTKQETKRRPKFPQVQKNAAPPRTRVEKPREERPRSKYSPQTGLPPNEKLRKFADELYGAMDIPFRKPNQ